MVFKAGDFARVQLEKHGWVEGAGLGRKETGIKEPIKVDIKQDNHGLGHDIAAEFTLNWWDHVYNKAANNINVQHSKNDEQSSNNDDVKVMKKTQPVARTYNNKSLLYNRFIKAATLIPEPTGTIEIPEPSTQVEEEEEPPVSLAKLTDEQLLKACGGRTAHKGARHGMGMNGKLDRIERHERQMLAKMEATESKRRVSFNSKVRARFYEKVSSVDEDEDEQDKNDLWEIKTGKSKKSKKRKKYKCSGDDLIGSSELVVCEEVTDINVKFKRKNKKAKKRKLSENTDCDEEITLPAVVAEECTDVSINLRKKRKKSRKTKVSNSEDLLTEQFDNGHVVNSNVVDNEPSEAELVGVVEKKELKDNGKNLLVVSDGRKNGHVVGHDGRKDCKKCKKRGLTCVNCVALDCENPVSDDIVVGQTAPSCEEDHQRKISSKKNKKKKRNKKNS